MPATISTIGGKAKAGPPGLRWINLGGIFTVTFGAQRNNSEGDPAAPCLALPYPASFRFRLVLQPGNWVVGIYCKQAINLSPRPTLTVRKNTDIGVNSDVVATAPSGTSWVTLATASFNVTTLGATYCDLSSNTTAENAAPCFWDHLTLTAV